MCVTVHVTACVPNFNNEVFEHSHLVCWVTRVGDDTREMRDSLLLSTGSAPDGGGDGELLLHQGLQLHHRDQLAPRTGAAAATSRRKERQTAQRSKVFFLLSFVGWIGAVLLLSYSVEYPEEPGTALRFWSVLAAPADYISDWNLDRDQPLPLKPVGERVAMRVCAACMAAIALLGAVHAANGLGPQREQVQSVMHRIYRPRRIPLALVVTAPRHRYFGTACMALLMGYLLFPKERCQGEGLNAQCERWPPPFGDNDLGHYGHHLGAVSMQLVAMAMVPIPKNSLLLHISGMPFERAIYHHRQLGRYAVLTGMAHSGIVFVDWSQSLDDDETLMDVLKENLYPFCAPKTDDVRRRSLQMLPYTTGTVSFNHRNSNSQPDKVTDSVWIGRGRTNAIYNQHPGSGEVRAGDHQRGDSPKGTLWCRGTVATCTRYVSFEGLTYKQRKHLGREREQFAMHVIAEDVYYNVQFTTWSKPGGFAYTRTFVRHGPAGAPPPPPPVVRAPPPPPLIHPPPPPSVPGLPNATTPGTGTTPPPSGPHANAADPGSTQAPGFAPRHKISDDGCEHDAWLLDSADVDAVANFCGLVALSAFLLLGLSAFSFIRRWCYGWWYRFHVLCTLTGSIALYFHHGLGSVDAAAPYVLLILVDYVLRAVRVLSRRPTIITAASILDSSEQPVACTFGVNTSTATGVSEPGQYFFICIPAISRTAWHPYSVINSIDAPDGSGSYSKESRCQHLSIV
eukprot:COSAG02_NODE_5374_length_4389_cov_3.643590_1_plen_737_part_00